MARVVTVEGKIASPSQPDLHLSGPKLRAALEVLIKSAEVFGGIDVLIEALKLKSAIFLKFLAVDVRATFELAEFEQLTATMPTVRRRVARMIEAVGWQPVRGKILELLDGASDTTTADMRIKAFCDSLPSGNANRFVRDLAAELLHNVYPEHYPLMQRWVWDDKANTGVIREIWHAQSEAEVDRMVIDVPDGYETFLALRQDLSQFLSDNGVFRDMLWFVDLLEAHAYGEYVNAQGGAYLKTDFSAAPEPLEHTRRILGLDAVSGRTGRTRFKTIDGSARNVDDIKLLN